MSFLRKAKQRDQTTAARPVDPADTQNRIDQQRRRRLQSGGRASTFLSAAVAEAAQAAPLATLTGTG